MCGTSKHIHHVLMYMWNPNIYRSHTYISTQPILYVGRGPPTSPLTISLSRSCSPALPCAISAEIVKMHMVSYTRIWYHMEKMHMVFAPLSLAQSLGRAGKIERENRRSLCKSAHAQGVRLSDVF